MFGLEPAPDLGECELGLCYVPSFLFKYLGTSAGDRETQRGQEADVWGFVLSAHRALHRLCLNQSSWQPSEVDITLVFIEKQKGGEMNHYIREMKQISQGQVADDYADDDIADI